MSKLIQAVRGMYDSHGMDARLWGRLDQAYARVMRRYAYDAVRTPIVESVGLFARAIGEVTDVVEKEMYVFEDRGGEKLALRPEGTAGVVRAGIENGLLYNQIQKFWYAGPMYRYERPQKGRNRQFHQMGAEVFGLQGPDIDIELIEMTAELWRELGILDGVTLEINTLGQSDERRAYRDQLVEFLRANFDALDADSQNRVDSNPLRVLDSKSPDTQALLAAAPTLMDFLGDQSRAHFDALKAGLDDAGIAYRVNPRLVRGLDYYNLTVFEWTTQHLGAQGTICGGGRYDGLVEQLGGKPTPGVGFALGVERVLLLIEALDQVPGDLQRDADVFMMATSDAGETRIRQLARELRAVSDQRISVLHGGGSFKSRMKKADRSGARVLVLLGDDEQANNQLSLKPLRGQGEQITIAQHGWLDALAALDK
ncbi:histidine--tRNA ligase [Litorivicinus lipolyticus]|uniref:histidine--tRNA ligase n=1 Tax=Litorivicinus lipolyticus TaxID=418701 RepID=UPI003B5C7A75